MFNRAATIGRAIESVLAQDDGDFEMLIVDDASTDESAAVVEGFQDARIRLLRHERNRGPCPARNTAVAAAGGEWCVMLDSDDELVRGALARLRERCAEIGRDVGNVASSCRRDDGRVTPRPLPEPDVLDGPSYLRWVSSLAMSDKLECIRRSVFAGVQYPDSRAWELEFHLDLTARWKVAIAADVLALVHSDAGNRLTTAHDEAAIERALAEAPAKLESFESSIRKHGAVLRAHVPEYFEYLSVLAGVQAAIAGYRRRALGHGLALLASRPLGRSTWSVLLLALAPARLAAWATLRRRRRLSI